MAIYICATCGKTFESDFKGKIPKYCSRYCHDHADKRKIRNCIVCGKPLPKNKEKYCSIGCRRQIANQNEQRMPHGELTKICCICGKEFRTYRSRKITCSEECSKIRENKPRENRKPKQRTDELRARERELYRKRTGAVPWDEFVSNRRKNAEERAKKAEEEKIKSLTKVCSFCGESFVAKYTWQKYCSDKCRKSAIKHHDKRVPKERLIDKDITLKKLFKRDGGKCYICGRDCSYDDRDGDRCFGRYPTIEHVIPLSRGGEHSWANVRLACWDCNIKKSTNVYKISPAPKYVGKEPTPPKRTIMYDLNGNIVGDFCSTGEAERKTGYKAKQLQKCCRGEIKSYKGYVWKYAE